jgi:L-asparagine transporter-like permease
MSGTAEDRSLGELFADLARESSTLVRQEVELAKVELSQKATQTARDIGFLAVGGAVIYAGVLAVLAAVVILLASQGMAWWLAALLVALVVVGVGYWLVQKGVAQLRGHDLAPRQTLDSLKQDARLVKGQTQ